MSLADYLSPLGIPHQIDTRARHRIVETVGSIEVSIISADSGSLALDKALAEPATHLAFVASSGRFTILNLGLVGTIYLHGPHTTEPQESAMQQLATRLKDDLDITIADWHTAPMKKSKAKTVSEPAPEPDALVVADPLTTDDVLPEQ
jgi:hypothetical protein